MDLNFAEGLDTDNVEAYLRGDDIHTQTAEPLIVCAEDSPPLTIAMTERPEQFHTDTYDEDLFDDKPWPDNPIGYELVFGKKRTSDKTLDDLTSLKTQEPYNNLSRFVRIGHIVQRCTAFCKSVFGGPYDALREIAFPKELNVGLMNIAKAPHFPMRKVSLSAQRTYHVHDHHIVASIKAIIGDESLYGYINYLFQFILELRVIIKQPLLL